MSLKIQSDIEYAQKMLKKYADSLERNIVDLEKTKSEKQKVYLAGKKIRTEAHIEKTNARIVHLTERLEKKRIRVEKEKKRLERKEQNKDKPKSAYMQFMSDTFDAAKITGIKVTMSDVAKMWSDKNPKKETPKKVLKKVLKKVPKAPENTLNGFVTVVEKAQAVQV